MAKLHRNKPRWQQGPGRHQRQRQDLWRAMLDQVLRSDVTPSAKVLASVLEGRHRDALKLPVIRIGFGGRTEWIDSDGRVHRCRPGLADEAQLDRRTMIRARDQLVQRGLLGCRRGGGVRSKYCGRGGRGDAAQRTAEERPEVLHEVGDGGRTPGGAGLACEYFPLAQPLPEVQEEGPQDLPPAIGAQRLREIRERAERERRERARGP